MSARSLSRYCTIGLCLPVLVWLSVAADCLAETAGAGPGAAQVVQSGDAPARFDIWEYRVAGNTRLETTAVERTVYPFLGPGRSLEDIEKARAALEKQFHDAGYPTVFVDIPEQKVVSGIVRLRIVEGRVDRLHVTGAQYHSPVQIRQEVPALASGEVPHLPEVKQQLEALSQESADRRITPIMRAGRTPGTLDVELQVDDALPLHGSLELNGHNTENTSRLRAMAVLRYDNLWQKYHSASLVYQTSPQETSEVKVLAATYALPLGERNRLALYAVQSNSESQVASAGALTVIGDGNIFGARLVVPLPSTATYFHGGTFGLDYKDFNEGTELTGSDTTTTPITYLDFVARYDGTWRGERQVSSFGAGINFSVRGLVSEQSEFDNKRAFSQADYAYLRANLKQERKLPYGLGLVARLEGQVADSALISNEQFSAGGAESVRGYHESQSLADNAVFASLELQKAGLARDIDWLNQLTGRVFLDGAWLHYIDPLPGEPRDSELYGAGLGFTLKAAGHFVSDLYLAWAMKDAGTVSEGDMRGDFRFAYEF